MKYIETPEYLKNASPQEIVDSWRALEGRPLIRKIIEDVDKLMLSDEFPKLNDIAAIINHETCSEYLMDTCIIMMFQGFRNRRVDFPNFRKLVSHSADYWRAKGMEKEKGWYWWNEAERKIIGDP